MKYSDCLSKIRTLYRRRKAQFSLDFEARNPPVMCNIGDKLYHIGGNFSGLTSSEYL